ncbi:MAG TPA: alpha/beta fold hydrolase [Anaerolineales bacterium]|nr:alpha/beta fold hydrolase [Anaerolineales bacterium]
MDQSTGSQSNNWFVPPLANPEAGTRLFLFPYAGGGPAVFKNWVSEFPSNVEVCIVHYPGRGSRHREPPIKQITTLVERLSQAIQPLLDKPFAFLGHSLGGLVAFELTRHLQRNSLPQPQMLFVSGCGAPHLSDPHLPIHSLPDSEFLKSLGQLNGIPSDVLDQPELLQFLLPILRADFEAVESYAFLSDEAPLHCPIVAFGGLDDPRVSRERMEAWALHTDSGFVSQYFPGDHFFINTARQSAMASIAAELTSTHAKN